MTDKDGNWINGMNVLFAKKNKERYERRLRARKELNIILDAVLEHFTHEKVVEYLKQYAIMQGRR